MTENKINNGDKKVKKIIKLSEVEGLTKEDAALIKKLGTIHTTWRDYTLMMLNSTADPLRSIWREKVVTSITHWSFNKGSISEGNVIGTEVLSVLPNELTYYVTDDAFEIGAWKKLGRLSGSKRMNVFLGHYPQESLSNEANLCLKFIIDNWDRNISDDMIITEEKWQGKKYSDIIYETPYLNAIFELALKTGGKCLTEDEILTYILEKPIYDSFYGDWIRVNEDIFANGIPSDKYKDYWKNDKIEGYPLAYKKGETLENAIGVDSNDEEIIRGDGIGVDNAEGGMNQEEYNVDGSMKHPDTHFKNIATGTRDTVWIKRELNRQGTYDEIEMSESEKVSAFNSLVDIILKESIAYSPCWKKIAICILKNDVSMKYAGFSATYKERLAREEAMAAFATKQEDKEKAKANAEALAKKIEKENRQKGLV